MVFKIVRKAAASGVGWFCSWGYRTIGGGFGGFAHGGTEL